jgi:hypothetical protein
MSESSSHIRLVQELVVWISKSFLDGETAHILADLPERTPRERPPTISTFIPDVYVCQIGSARLVIGEAKTGQDVDSRHTREQVRAFLHRCAGYEASVFILAVPWDVTRLAKSILKDLQSEVGAYNVNIIVLDKLPG